MRIGDKSLVRSHVRRVLLLAGLVFAALPAGSALADTTIGQTGGDNLCRPLVIGERNYVVPSGGGTITSFSFQSDPTNKGQQLDFLVLRPTFFDRFLVVGKTGVVTLKGTGLETFSANISVAGGDFLGFWTSHLDNCSRDGTGSLVAKFGISDPDTGATFAMQPIVVGDLNESATLAPSVGEPPPPTSKQQCKHGGWRNFGSRFKNQGQCVRFVEHQHHKHHPGG